MNNKKRVEILIKNLIYLPNTLGDYWVVGILFLFIIFFGFATPRFFSLSCWLITSVYAVQFILVALAETFVIITGGIDISVGSIMGISSMTAAWVMRYLIQSGISLIGSIIFFGLLTGICTGILVGFINGYFITRFNISPIIATLATLSIGQGLIFLLSSQTIADIPESLGKFVSTILIGFLPISVLITTIVVVIFYIILHKTTFGRHTYAIGSNPEAARLAGINNKKHLVKIYVISGLLSAIAGLLVLMRFTSASPLTGSHFELQAIAAAVIGGASLAGGKGTVIGAFSGAAIISILITGLVLLNVDPYWQLVATGVVLVFAVYIDQQRLKKVTRKRAIAID